MDKNKVKIHKRKAKKTEAVNLRITKAMSKWIKEKKYSATNIFVEACRNLGFVEKEEKD